MSPSLDDYRSGVGREDLSLWDGGGKDITSDLFVCFVPPGGDIAESRELRPLHL